MPATIEGAMTTIILEQAPIALDSNYSQEIVNSSAFLNAVANAPLIERDVTAIIQLFLDDIAKQTAVVSALAPLCATVAIFSSVLCAAAFLWISVRALRASKGGAHRCLAAVPKSALSTVLDALHKSVENVHDERQPKEVLKREENIVEILNTGRSPNASSGLGFFICAVIALIGGLAVSTAFFATFFMSEAVLVRSQVPHLTSVITAYSRAIGGLWQLHMIAMNRTGPRVHISSSTEANAMARQYLRSGAEAYNLARVGGDGFLERPFEGWETAAAAGLGTTSNDPFELSPNLAYVSLEPIALSQLMETNSATLTSLWYTAVSVVYDRLIGPVSDSVFSTINARLLANFRRLVVIAAILLSIETLCAIAAWVDIGSVSMHIRGILRLLLHCPASVVVQTPSIMAVLTGDFSLGKMNRYGDDNRKAGFFESVFNRIPEAIAYADTDLIARGTNQACDRLFGESLIGRNLREVFESGQFTGETESLFDRQRSSQVQTLEFRKRDGQDIHIEVTTTDAGTVFIVTLRDVTQDIRCRALLAEERKRSDDLLRTILPESLVPRVRSGQRDISFSVESATVLFLNIVGFTPWCESLPGSMVMSILNDLFKRLDQALVAKPTMTKIKCIGDCYMAAGGIFGGGYGPQEHALEVVKFGIEAIAEVRALNETQGQNLAVRVGVNTGGPIVAGVLGIGKPTFEVFGPTICVAYQMEHTGVPMAVHITEATRRYIDGGGFVVEDHSVQIKGKEVKTGLVRGNSIV
jgi:PAS domain S-box-containing protein